MNRFASVAVAAIVAAGALFGADANQMHYVQVLNPSDTAAVTGSAVDVAAYKGNATFAVECGVSAIAGNTNIVTLTHCTTSSGTYSTVTNTAGTAVCVTRTGAFTNTAPDTVSIDSARLHRYVKGTVSQPGKYTNVVSAVLIFPMKAQ